MTEEKEMTSGELQKLLEKDKNTRVQNCKQEIDIILQKYNCQIISFPQYTSDGRTVAVAQIQAVPNKV